MPAKLPNMDPMPSASSIVKNKIDQNGAQGSSTMAWVNTMNAKPVPSAAWIKRGEKMSHGFLKNCGSPKK